MQPGQLNSVKPHNTDSAAPYFGGADASSIREFDGNGSPSQFDPVLSKLRSTIDSYQKRVKAWDGAVRPLAWKQRIPSPTTIGLLILGAAVTLVVNILAFSHDATLERASISNLGAMVVLALAGISLFYDRTVRGYGRELLLRDATARSSELLAQLQTLAGFQTELRQDMLRRGAELDSLRVEIEAQNEIAEDLKQQNVTARSQHEEYELRLAELRQLIMDEVSRLQRSQHSVSNLQAEQKELELSIQAHSDQLFEVAEQRERVTAELQQCTQERDQLQKRWESEQSEHNRRVERERADLERLQGEVEAATLQLESIRSDLDTIRELRTEMQCELEMIREEHERNTAASIQAMAQLRAEMGSLDEQKRLAESAIEQQKQDLIELQSEFDQLKARIDESTHAKRELEIELGQLLGQIRESQMQVESLEGSIEREQELLHEQRQRAERELQESDAKLSERRQAILDLEQTIALATQERESLGLELNRLAGVKNAMEISVDELTHRLELRSTELRKKNQQLQEHADRLERLSDAIQKLVARESEIRQSTGSEAKSIQDVIPLPAADGEFRGVHGAHIVPMPRGLNAIARPVTEFFEG